MARSAHGPAILDAVPANVKTIKKKLMTSQLDISIWILLFVNLTIPESPHVISIMGSQQSMILQRTFTRKAKPFEAGNFRFVIAKKAM
jgi:hypothetical protein